MFQYIVLDLRVGCPILKFGHIHIFQRELNPNLFRVDLALGKQDNRLDVLRPGEHVHGPDAADAVAARGQHLQIPRQGLRVAGDVDHPVGGGLQQGLEKALIAAGAGRVEEDHVRPVAVPHHVLHIFPRVPRGEPAVFDAVCPGVCDGVPHRVPVELHADDLSGPAACCDADGADAAVGVQHRLRARQGGKVHRRLIEHLGLHGIDLVEGAGGDAEDVAAEGIFDGPRAIEHLLPVAQHHGGEAVVDVEHHGSNLRVHFQQLFHKGLLGGEDGGDRHQHHQRFACGKAPAHQHVPQPAPAAALVKDLDLEIPQHVPDIHDDPVGGAVLEKAVVHRHHLVAVRLIDAGDDVFLLIQGEGGGDLVAVVGGVCHADNVLHAAERTQQGDDPALLAPELFGIGQALELAPAAGFIVFARGRKGLFHRTPQKAEAAIGKERIVAPVCAPARNDRLTNISYHTPAKKQGGQGSPERAVGFTMMCDSR